MTLQSPSQDPPFESSRPSTPNQDGAEHFDPEQMNSPQREFLELLIDCGLETPGNLGEIFSMNEFNPDNEWNPEDNADPDSEINPDSGNFEVGNPEDGYPADGYHGYNPYSDDACHVKQNVEQNVEQNSIVFIPFRLADIQSLIEAKTTIGESQAFYPGEQFCLPPQEYDFESDLPVLPPFPFAPYPPKIMGPMEQQEPQSVSHDSSIPQENHESTSEEYNASLHHLPQVPSKRTSGWSS